MDISKAHEADNGFLITDGPFYTGGTASPIGLDLPTGTFYLQDTASGVLIYRKFGANVADWRQLSAQDVPFDVAPVIARSPDLTGLTTTQEVGEALANRLFGSFFGIGRFNNNFQSVSATYEDAFVVNISNPRRGRYLLFWSYRQNNSKSNTDSQTQARFNDLALVTNTVLGNATSVQTPLGGGLGEQFSGFGEFSILDLANLKLSLAIQRTSGNGGARINTMNIMAFRVDYQ